MDKKKNIILIGMMGCGKTTIGHLLDEKITNFQYVDIDKEIEKEAKKSIPEIFEQDGEEHFRDIENRIFSRFCNYHNQVISTGGGIVEKAENMNIMKENGVVFYLRANIDSLFERVIKTNNRPKLLGDNPKQVLKDLIKKREPNYNKADFIIETEKKELLEIVKEIAQKYDSSYRINS